MCHDRRRVKGRLAGQQGYVILTVLCLFALFTSLGVALLTTSLAGRKSVARKAFSAQADSYAISLVESFNTELTGYNALTTNLQKWFGAYYVGIDEQEEIRIPRGEPHTFTAHLTLPDSREQVDLTAVLTFVDLVFIKDADSLMGVAYQGKLEGFYTITYTQDGRSQTSRYQCMYTPIKEEDGWLAGWLVKEMKQVIEDGTLEADM